MKWDQIVIISRRDKYKLNHDKRAYFASNVIIQEIEANRVKQNITYAEQRQTNSENLN